MTARIALPLLLMAACGGGSSSGPIDEESAQDPCRQGCEWSVDCQLSTDVEVCTTECIADVAGIWREDVFIDYADCVSGQACTAQGDACFDECSPTGSHQAYEDSCREGLGQCDLTIEQIDGICEVTPNAASDLGGLCVIATPIIDELEACMDEADCTARLNCMNAVYEAHGITG